MLLTSCGEKSRDINKKDKELLQEEVSTNTHITASSAPSMETTKVISIDKGNEKNVEISNMPNISSMDDHIGIYCYDYEDDTPDLIEDHYIVLKNVRGRVIGRYYGTSDDFDQAREGYNPGFFVADMRDLQIVNNEISFAVYLSENDLFSKPVNLKYKYSKGVPIDENPLWQNKQIIEVSDNNPRKYKGKIVNGEIIVEIEDGKRIFKKVTRKASDTELVTKTEKKVNKIQDTLDFNNFRPIQDAFEKSDLNRDSSEDDLKYTIYVKGEIDLNSDGKKDKLNCTLHNNSDNTISINGYNLNLFINDVRSSQDFQIVDLDINDPYKEIVIMESGFDGEYYPTFIRYDGNKLFTLGNLPGDLLIDKDGKLISSFNVYKEVYPVICSGYYEIVGDTFRFNKLNLDTILNKRYTFIIDQSIAFDESNTLPKKDKTVFVDTFEAKDFKAGDSFILNVMGFIPETDNILWLNVTLKENKKGNIYLVLQP